MKKIYEVLVLLGLVYIAWFVFASVTGDNSLLWQAMDVFGATAVTLAASIFAIAFVLLSFGNVKWIPSLARDKRIGLLSLHVVGAIIGIVLVVLGGLAFLG